MVHLIPPTLQIGILAIAIATILATSFIAQRFAITMLRSLEGYWCSGRCRLLILLIRHQKTRHCKPIQKLSKLNPNLIRSTDIERVEFARCDHTPHQFLTKEHDLLLTSLGNVLRAAERRPRDRYGLVAVVC